EGVESFLEKRTAVYPVKVSDGIPDIFPDYEDPQFE
ncbi:MAG: enoyl-CoA hydratase, partial [Actinobacteria bacterium]